MLRARAFRVENVLDRVLSLADYFTVGDYHKAKDAATKRIVKRQSRGNIFAQNGWYMSKDKLDKKSRKADRDIEFITRSLPR